MDRCREYHCKFCGKRYVREFFFTRHVNTCTFAPINAIVLIPIVKATVVHPKLTFDDIMMEVLLSKN